MKYDHARMQKFHDAVLKLADEHFPEKLSAHGKAQEIFGFELRYELIMEIPEPEDDEEEENAEVP